MSKADKLQKSSFSLVLAPEQNIIKTGLLGCAATFIGGLVLVKITLLRGLPFVIKVGGFFTALVFLALAILGFIYLYGISKNKKPALELNEEGLLDHASFCLLGNIELTALSKVEIVVLSGLHFLVFRFVTKDNPLFKSNNWRVVLYRSFIGTRLWIPLFIFRLARQDLESQLIHFEHVFAKKRNGKALPLAILSPPVDESPKVGDTPPPLAPVTPPPKARSAIELIKEEIRESKFDRLITDLFYEYLAKLPERHLQGGELIPARMSAVHSKKRADYEEITFIYQQKEFAFGLRKNIGDGNEALLSVGVGGRVHMTLRVLLEIGEISPIELESFVSGSWRGILTELVQDLKLSDEKALRKRLGREHTQTNTDLTSYKGEFDTSD